MKIIIGHSNMDLDCIGSVIIAKYLFPDYLPIKSRYIHPMAESAENLFQYRLGYGNLKDLKGKRIDNIMIVDTRSRNRVKEYLDLIENDDYQVEVFDHHPGEVEGLDNAVLHPSNDGANTTQLVKRAEEEGVVISPDDATLALAGIHADTGNFTHDNITENDYSAAAFLMKAGASMKIVRTLLKPLKDKEQFALFHEIVNKLEYTRIMGHKVVFSYHEGEDEFRGIGAVVERIFDVEDQDAYFGVFHFLNKEKTLIIARSQNDHIDLRTILSDFGGGGHSKAASATVRNQDGSVVFSMLKQYLESFLVPAVCVEDMMSRDVVFVRPDTTLLETSLLLEKNDYTGLPVLDEKDNLCGMITLRDIMKGRRGNQMHSAVKTFMSKKLITGNPSMAMHEVEEFFFLHGIGHLPIPLDDRLVGIVTRSDFIRYKKSVRHKMESLALGSNQ